MPGLQETATALVAPGKGVLAADESIGTMSKRLEGVGVPANPDTRRDYRELLAGTPGLSAWVSGIILSDETLRQSFADGTAFPEAARSRGVQPGIKVDKGVVPLPFTESCVVTEGLDGLRARMEEYRTLGATFAKWRAVLAPVGLCDRSIHANAHALARYASYCQEAGIVPIVEPEVLMDGDHDITTCRSVTSRVLGAVFEEIDVMGVDPSGMVLKPNMVISGTTSAAQSSPEEVAEATVAVLAAWLPKALPGVAFLSGGQSNERACANLEAVNRAAEGRDDAPWRLTFSFGRALVDDALRTWHGDGANVDAAREALAANCGRASAASSPSGRGAEEAVGV
ncbi:MAG: class I fructose-bisphosphate aldolase [Acidimicrobiales bacterium]